MSGRNKQGQTRYNSEWEKPELFAEVSKWILPVNTENPDDVHYFSCKVYKSGKISLSNMGKHMNDLNPVQKPTKHTKRMQDIKKKQERLLHTITICRLRTTTFFSIILKLQSLISCSNHYQCYLY